MPELGRAALVVCFGLALYARRAPASGRAHTRPPPPRAVRRRTRCSPPSAPPLVASAVLLVALAAAATSRFTYVAEHTSRELPAGYTLAAFWGGQEGSLLLWLLVLTGFAAAAVLLDRKAGRELVAWVVPVLGVVGDVLRLHARRFVASPFDTQPPPADGAGLNPSLQNPYMLAHPPLLYLGYVGLTVPFAFAMGALLSRRTDERWIVATRRWTLARLDVPRRRPAARRALGVRGGRLGRLLRLGPGRERRADALARGHRVPALGDGPGEARGC